MLWPGRAHGVQSQSVLEVPMHNQIYIITKTISERKVETTFRGAYGEF